jgi:thiamine phosphate synthase YjbQ (UPF0047 family)
MPAHIKTSLLGNNPSTPIIVGTLGFGTWKVTGLGEQRIRAGNHQSF